MSIFFYRYIGKCCVAFVLLCSVWVLCSLFFSACADNSTSFEKRASIFFFSSIKLSQEHVIENGGYDREKFVLSPLSYNTYQLSLKNGNSQDYVKVQHILSGFVPNITYHSARPMDDSMSYFTYKYSRASDVPYSGKSVNLYQVFDELHRSNLRLSVRQDLHSFSLKSVNSDMSGSNFNVSSLIRQDHDNDKHALPMMFGASAWWKLGDKSVKLSGEYVYFYGKRSIPKERNNFSKMSYYNPTAVEKNIGFTYSNGYYYRYYLGLSFMDFDKYFTLSCNANNVDALLYAPLKKGVVQITRPLFYNFTFSAGVPLSGQFKVAYDSHGVSVVTGIPTLRWDINVEYLFGGKRRVYYQDGGLVKYLDKGSQNLISRRITHKLAIKTTLNAFATSEIGVSMSQTQREVDTWVKDYKEEEQKGINEKLIVDRLVFDPYVKFSFTM